jgi:succinate dehydrogenase / fumarate reductase flavoprotein subunit
MLISHDAVIVGAGGAGLRAAVELAKAGVDAAVLTKLYPTRSHTGAAQGGVCAALGNQEEDHWEWHMFDTIKGGDYLVDQDAAEVLAREAIETVIELEHMGLPFNRTPDGRIDQRRFGGHTRNFGEAPVKRACFAADRTGHMILQTLYQQCVKAGVRFYDEYHVVDLLFEGGDAGEGGRAAGVVAYRIATASSCPGRRPCLATGEFGRCSVTSNAVSLTGDGCRWPTGTASRRRTWSSTSSTPRASWGSGSCCPRPRVARAPTSSTTMASGSWSATLPS